MRDSITLPPRSLSSAVRIGALTGLIVLGIGGRFAMRVLAELQAHRLQLSVEGTLAVVVAGAVTGAFGGFLLWCGRRYMPHRPVARGLFFWGTVLVLASQGLHPLTIVKMALFGPLVVAWGAVLYRIWCMRFVARWAVTNRVALQSPT